MVAHHLSDPARARPRLMGETPGRGRTHQLLPERARLAGGRRGALGPPRPTRRVFARGARLSARQAGPTLTDKPGYDRLGEASGNGACRCTIPWPVSAETISATRR